VADDPLNPTDLAEVADDPQTRVESDLETVAPDKAAFGRLLDDSVAHVTAAAEADPAGLRWAPVGARNIGGRIRAVAQHPSDANVLWAGSGFGGLWRTEDGGDTWTPLESFPPAGSRRAPPVGAIAVARRRSPPSPGDPRILYVGTGEPVVWERPGAGNYSPDWHYPGNGLYRSNDGGLTFVQVAPPDGPPIDARRFERIRVDPWHPDRYWVASTAGLHRHIPADDFGDPRSDTPPADGRVTVYAAMRGAGIFRRVYDRNADAYEGTGWERLENGLPDDVYRIKLAHSWSRTRQLYAVFGLPEAGPASDRKWPVSPVYRSTDGGDSWSSTGARPDDHYNNQSWYDLVLEVHPDHPEIVVVGAVDLFRTLNAGEGWEKVIDWLRYNDGDRAQHADQHAVAFDVADERAFWVGNDGGISLTRNLGATWRKRSHGILATQFHDVTAHPTFPAIRGGGLQDNGSWISYGGGSWYYLFGGDGGAVAPVPGNPRRSFLGSQGVALRNDVAGPPGIARYRYRNPAPDLAAVPASGFPAENRRLTGFADAHGPIFKHLVVQHPTTANHALLGRKRAGYVTTNGATVTVLNTGAFTPASAEVSALAYAPTALPHNGRQQHPGRGLDQRHPGGHDPGRLRHRRASRERQHRRRGRGEPARPDLAHGQQGDRLVGDLRRHRAPPLPGGHAAGHLAPLRALPGHRRGLRSHEPGRRGRQPGPLRGDADRGARDPERPGRHGAGPAGSHPRPRVAHLQREPPPGPGQRPHHVGGAGRRRQPGAPGAPPGHPRPGDLRVRPGRGARRPALRPGFGGGRGPDLPRSPGPARRPAGEPVAGDEHRVHVQVHNGGVQATANVEVRLFQADAGGGVPDLQADFWTGWPAPGAGAWTEVGSVRTIPSLSPGNPVVVAFAWTPPVGIGARAALLALVTHATDALPTGTLPTVVADLVRDERRASLRVVDVNPFVPDVYIRDGVDDRGGIGGVGWGGRSPDVVVLRDLVADPRAELADLGDRRADDFVRTGSTSG